MDLRTDCNKMAKRERYESLTRSVYDKCIFIIYCRFVWPSEHDKINRKWEKWSKVYTTCEKERRIAFISNVLLFIPILSFFFLLVFCVSFCQIGHEGEQKQCIEFGVVLYFSSYLLLYNYILLYTFIYFYILIFGPRRDEVTGEWRRLHNEELNDLYSSPNIVRLIKIEKNEMGWTCGTYGWGMGCIGSWWGNRRERVHWGDLGVDEWTILG